VGEGEDDQSDIRFVIASNQFWGESAKIGIPTFIHCAGIPQHIGELDVISKSFEL